MKSWLYTKESLLIMQCEWLFKKVQLNISEKSFNSVSIFYSHPHCIIFSSRKIEIQNHFGIWNKIIPTGPNGYIGLEISFGNWDQSSVVTGTKKNPARTRKPFCQKKLEGIRQRVGTKNWIFKIFGNREDNFCNFAGTDAIVPVAGFRRTLDQTSSSSDLCWNITYQ